MSKFLTKLLSEVKIEESASEFEGFIDTGSYTLNAALSGSLFGGVPSNKISTFAGDPGVGKTFIALGIVKQFLDANPKGVVVYFDTELALPKKLLSERGIDVTRVVKMEPLTIQQFRDEALKIIHNYLEMSDAERKAQPLLFVLDSQGQLSTNKEIGDATDQTDVKDMTRPGLIKGAFRVLRMKLGRANIPLIVTNHVYNVIGAYIPTKNMSGGSGLEYSSDTIVFLSKKKDRDTTKGEKSDVDTGITGVIVSADVRKSRLSRENTKVSFRINYVGGLDRYYGLTALCVAAGIFEDSGKKLKLPDGTSVFRKQIDKAPEKYFTEEVLKRLDNEYIATHFRYVSNAAVSGVDVSSDDTDEGEDE